jgi:hypothetical protein
MQRLKMTFNNKKCGGRYEKDNKKCGFKEKC